MRYKIPDSLSCDHCTLQWYYSTGNTCYYDGGYLTHFKQMAEQGWSVSGWILHGSHLDSWVTCENTCYYDGGYLTHFKQMAEQGWSVSDWILHGSHLDSWVTCENTCCGPNGNGGFGEEFWNCADIAVLPSGQGGGGVTETPVATTTPAPASSA